MDGKAKIVPVYDGEGNVRYRAQRVFSSLPAAEAGKAALEHINPRAFTPGLCAGEPFDAPEPAWPSDATSRVYPPPCDGIGATEALIELHEHKDEP